MAKNRNVGRTALSLLAVVLLAPLFVVAGSPAVGAATPVGPFDVDLSNRESVRRFFFDVHQASEGIPIGWTGNIAGCDPGTVSQDFLDATLTRINYFRAMAGVPSDVTFTAANNARAQATALIIGAHRSLGTPQEDAHAPPQSWECWTQEGFTGAGQSNLALGNTGPAAIDQLVRDGGLVGHRRTMLNPQVSSMGSGSIPATATSAAAEAQLMVEPGDIPPRPARDQFVAWPAKGFAPYQVVPGLWSFVLRGADFSNATVSMERNGVTVQPPIESRANFAGPGIVWQANGLAAGAAWPKPVEDELWNVTVGNVVVDGVLQDFTYPVTVFDPAVADPTRTPLVITGPDNPPLNVASTYTTNGVPNATGFQWRTTKLSPLELTDGAEAGLANFDADLGGALYTPVSPSFAATGTSSFRLTTGQGGVPPLRRSTLTFKRPIVPNEQSVLTFKTRAIRTTNMSPVVEASTDEGATWKILYQELNTDDVAFNDRLVPLAALAGEHVLLRFRIENTLTGGTFCCGSEGWYFDDVTLANLQAADPPVLTPVTPATSFPFTPTAPSEFDIEVRPNFAGSGFGAWSKAKRVSTLPTDIVPTITVQPQDVAVADGGTATLTVSAAGTTPLSFAWSRNGTPLADGPDVTGATSATLTLTNVSTASAGSYTVRVTNAAGVVDSGAATVTVTPGLAAALDGPQLAWATTGDGPWAPQALTTHDGTDAAQSGAVADNQASHLDTTVAGPATVSFWWKVDSETNFDKLSVTVDGVRPFPDISGNVDWQQKTITLPAGNHLIRWSYTRDGSVAVGQNAGWVDQVVVGPPAAAVSLADAADTGGRAVITSGDLGWAAQTATTHDGTDAAQSGAVADNQASHLDTTVAGPATVSFWWKVDSEANFDKLSVTVDGVPPFPDISGNIDWQQKTLTLPAGDHVIRWSYTRDGSVAVGANAGWVDQVVVTAA